MPVLYSQVWLPPERLNTLADTLQQPARTCFCGTCDGRGRGYSGRWQRQTPEPLPATEQEPAMPTSASIALVQVQKGILDHSHALHVATRSNHDCETLKTRRQG